MANLPGTLEFQIRDDNGLVNPLTLYVAPNTTMTLAQIQTAVDALTAAVAAVTDGGMPKVTLTIDLVVNGGNVNPVAESNNQEGALLTFYQANTKYVCSVFVPNFKDSLSVQGLIENTGAVQTLTNLIDGTTTAGLAITSPFGNLLTAFARGRTVFRRFAKQLARAASGRHNA